MVKVAAVQASPVWLDAKGTLDKTIALIEDAGRKDIRMLAFGEVWLPGYPFSIWLLPPMQAMEIVMRHRANAITVDGSEMRAVGAAAKRAGVQVAIGYAERGGASAERRPQRQTAGGIVHARSGRLPTASTTGSRNATSCLRSAWITTKI